MLLENRLPLSSPPLPPTVVSVKMTERIRLALTNSEDSIHPRVQKYAIGECRKWSLVWMGLNKVASSQYNEMEFLLGQQDRGQAE